MAGATRALFSVAVLLWATPLAEGQLLATLPAGGQISAGVDSTCALAPAVDGSDGGRAWCWGRNNLGQLGDGTNIDRLLPVAVLPPENSTDVLYTQISTGTYSTCALSTTGRAYCWGRNSKAQVGDGTTDSRRRPTPVAGDATWTQISTGQESSCGVQVDSTGWCWGENNNGEVGDGTNRLKLLPTQILGNYSWTAVYAYTASACGLQTDNTAWCWGFKLGNVETSPLASRPVKVAGGGAWESISKTAGGNSCGVKSGGGGFCWGENEFGQLGDGTTTMSYVPVPISGGAEWSSLGARGFSSVGLQGDGTAFGWGSNTAGQLGSGFVNASGGATRPVPAAGNLTYTQLSAGGDYSCALASGTPIGQNGSVFCYGTNRYGQLGTGNTASVSSPTAVVWPLPSPPSPPPSPPSPSSPPPVPISSSSSSVGVIAGAVVGGLAFVAIVAGALVFRARHRRRMDDSEREFGNAKDVDSTKLLSADPLLAYLASRPLVSLPSRTSSAGSKADLKDWQINWEDLVIERPIGVGSLGRVYLASWNHVVVAVKVLLGANEDPATSLTMDMDNDVVENLRKEALLMASLRHPNVVNFLGACGSPPAIISEFCTRGSLYHILHQAKRDPAVAAELTWSRRIGIALDAAGGMHFLHSHQPQIVHRDLKSPNLLIEDSWRCKVADFNLSKIMEESATASTLGATNPRWLAPEVLAGMPTLPANDAFAFGMVLWELLTWDLPWQAEALWAIAAKVVAGGRPELPERSALPGPDSATWAGLDEYTALLQSCWQQDAASRPTFGDILVSLRAIQTKYCPSTEGLSQS